MKAFSRLIVTLLLIAAFLSNVMPCGPGYTTPLFDTTSAPENPYNDYAAGRLGIVKTTYSRSVLYAAYRYDWDGELIEAWDKLHGRTEYQYDPVGQLVAMVPEKARGELFRHDPAGNLFEASTGAKAREYGKGNRLLQRGDTAYAWDDDGRLVEKVVKEPATGRERRWQYRWNGAGLLAAATGPDGTVVEMTYDPFARRLQKRVSRPATSGGKPSPIALTRFVWDGDVLVHEIRRAPRVGGDPVVEERT